MAWLETGPTEAEQTAVLDALQVIVAHPFAAGERQPARAPVYAYPVPGFPLEVVYLVAEQFHTVKIIEVRRA